MGRAAAGRRPGRSARRSALSEKGQCALLRIRGNRLEQAARLRIAGGLARQICAILLGQGVSAHSERHPLPERDLERAAVDQRPLQQCLSRRARTAPFRAAALGKLRASSNMNPRWCEGKIGRGSREHWSSEFMGSSSARKVAPPRGEPASSNESFVEAEALERRDRDWRSPEAGNGTWPCECARSLELRFSLRMAKMVPAALQSTL